MNIKYKIKMLNFRYLNFAIKFITADAGSCAPNGHEKGINGGEELGKQAECNKIYDCICLLCRVLMNISHENGED